NKINDPRSLGTILAFELNNGKKDYLNQQKQRIIDIAMKEGVFLRPLGNTIYLMPPYCITMEEQEKLYDVLEKIIGDV
ncbi:MAG TPA: aminotransferase class III-fold pyridoxal phosphate-dependent enzyme, partial [Chitinophagaceae bacterium]